MAKITLTDWPKTESIPANLRGVETDELKAKYREMYHAMMISTAETAGGYSIFYDCDAILDELKFRGEKT